MAGAGEGNRTLVCSLGSCRSTIELRPPLGEFLRPILRSVNNRGASAGSGECQAANRSETISSRLRSVVS